MFYVYILKSRKDNNLYIGSTNNLRKRLKELIKVKLRLQDCVFHLD